MAVRGLCPTRMAVRGAVSDSDGGEGGLCPTRMAVRGAGGVRLGWRRGGVSDSDGGEGAVSDSDGGEGRAGVQGMDEGVTRIR